MNKSWKLLFLTTLREMWTWFLPGRTFTRCSETPRQQVRHFKKWNFYLTLFWCVSPDQGVFASGFILKCCPEVRWKDLRTHQSAVYLPRALCLSFLKPVPHCHLEIFFSPAGAEERGHRTENPENSSWTPAWEHGTLRVSRCQLRLILGAGLGCDVMHCLSWLIALIKNGDTNNMIKSSV